MNKRIAKKQAKLFLAGKKKFPIHRYEWICDTDGNYVTKVSFIIPERVLKEVNRIALDNGWDGCHWDAPELLGTIEDGKWYPNTGWYPVYREPLY